jgi:hypothetical protein
VPADGLAGATIWAGARMKQHTGALSARNRGSLFLTLVTGGCLAILTACVIPLPSTPPNVVRGTDGEVLDLTQIDPILNNTSLTEQQKRQQLLDLGMPEEVADALLRAS